MDLTVSFLESLIQVASKGLDSRVALADLFLSTQDLNAIYAHPQAFVIADGYLWLRSSYNTSIESFNRKQALQARERAITNDIKAIHADLKLSPEMMALLRANPEKLKEMQEILATLKAKL